MDSSIKKAEERLEYLSSDPYTIELYKKREESEHEKANVISGAKAAGRVEEKFEVAKNLLDLGIDISIITKSTGLSEEEIRKLGHVN